jgi:hypothetical protein
MESELTIGHNIQIGMVPKLVPPFTDRKEFDLFATLDPAKEVGGDFYDFFFINDDNLCFLIGDVSGKGVPAALFMAVTKTLIKNTAIQSDDPAEILKRVNDEAIQTLPIEQFEGVELKEGLTLYGQGEQGQTVQVTVKSFNDKDVVVDFNHPLAGKDLMFSVNVLSAREATADEISSGQVGGEHCESGSCGCGH